ncbi:MAG: hypothetical protein HYR88_13505 [Verrucomicrobia bacterium]|nr:hypothetical protein [Verrucomicrobiota bacterium]MBI3867191.1 hypothetical protein [Verrucomicrobiota bacterium]
MEKPKVLEEAAWETLDGHQDHPLFGGRSDEVLEEQCPERSDEQAAHSLILVDESALSRRNQAGEE